MNKRKTLILVGLIGALAVILAIIATRQSGGDAIISRREAERCVQEIKQKIKLPDEATRENIDKFTNDLAREHEFIEVEGEKRTVSTIAGHELFEIGKPAIPQLIDAAANHNDPIVRGYALGIIYLICEDLDNTVMEYLPVFIRSMWDKNGETRMAAVAQIGQMARRFYRHKRQKELEQLIPYLVKALRDKDEIVQIIAGETLFRIGRRDLVSEELIKKERWEHSS